VGLHSRMDEDTLEQMQNQIAFLERAVSELSDVVFRQQQEIQAAEAKLKAVSDRLDSVRSDEALRPLEQERPPHY
jgi:SlyX protein